MIYQAGFINFLRTIVIIVGVIYLLRILARIFFPIMLNRYINKQQQNMHQQYQKQADFRNQKQTQSTTKKEKHLSDEIGEYVDYEEINE